MALLAQRVATPDRKLRIISSEVELKALCNEYDLTAYKARNLAHMRQLLQWNAVGNGSGDANDRKERLECMNFQLLKNISWLQRDGGTELVPVVGKPAHIWSTVVQSHPQMSFT